VLVKIRIEMLTTVLVWCVWITWPPS